MQGTVTAQYLSYHLKKELDSIGRLADQLQNGQIEIESVAPLLRQEEKQFRLLSKAAEIRGI